MHLSFSNGGPCDIVIITCVAFVYNGPTHAIMEAARALGGSFKLVALVPETVNCSGKHKRMGT